MKPVDADGASSADASDDEELNQTQLPDNQAENDDAIDTTDTSDENASGEEEEKEKGTVDTAEKIMEANNNVSISTARNTRQLLSNFDEDFSDDDTSQNFILVEDFRSPSPAPKSKKTAAAARITSRSKKRRGETETESYVIPTHSENERGRKKAKGTPRARSIADALVEIEDKKTTLAIEQDRLARLDRQQHLDREVKQRDQQHEEKGYQHQQVILQLELQLEVAKVSNARSARRFSSAQKMFSSAQSKGGATIRT